MYDAIKKHLVTEPLIHADETVLQVLKEPGRKATTESRMWVYTSGQSLTPAVLFEYQPTRSGCMPDGFWKVFRVISKQMAIVVTMQYLMLYIVDAGLIYSANLKKQFLMEQIAKVPRRLLDMITVTAYLPWK